LSAWLANEIAPPASLAEEIGLAREVLAGGLAAGPALPRALACMS
jgi:hypothetical protein